MLRSTTDEVARTYSRRRTLGERFRAFPAKRGCSVQCSARGHGPELMRSHADTCTLTELRLKWRPLRETPVLFCLCILAPSVSAN